MRRGASGLLAHAILTSATQLRWRVSMIERLLPMPSNGADGDGADVPGVLAVSPMTPRTQRV